MDFPVGDSHDGHVALQPPTISASLPAQAGNPVFLASCASHKAVVGWHTTTRQPRTSMTGPRFKPLPPEQMTAEQTRVAQALTQGPRGGVRGPFLALLRIPALADRVRALGDYVRFESALPPPLSELAILVVARFWTAQYEWYAHSRHAVKAGVDPSVPEAIAEGKRPPKLSADEALVYDFCSELLNARDVSDKTFA